MIERYTQLLFEGKVLSSAEMSEAMEIIMSGSEGTDAVADFLRALSGRETVEEVTAAAEVMRVHCLKIHTGRADVLDTCGTGGDKKGTFNVSTAAAFVAAGCGITVAKHGNRSVSSNCGSADILEACGINICLSPEQTKECLLKTGIAFLFAPAFHPSVRYAMPARRQIKGRTIFNLLGPLVNPAGTRHQLVGVYERNKTCFVCEVLANLGSLHVLAVHGSDGLDEITIGGVTYVCEFNRGSLREFEISPEDMGFSRRELSSIAGNGPAANAVIMLDVLKGASGAYRDTVLMNAAVAIYAADAASSLEEAMQKAVSALDSGRALEKFNLLREFTVKQERK